MAKVNVGLMACHECGHDVYIKENEKGGLSYTCQVCDNPDYAPKTLPNKQASWRKKMRPIPGQEQEKTEPEESTKQPPGSAHKASGLLI